MPGDLQFLNSFRALRHSPSETMPSRDNFSSSFKEVTFSVSKKVSLEYVRVSDPCDFFLSKNFKLVGRKHIIVDL